MSAWRWAAKNVHRRGRPWLPCWPDEPWPPSLGGGTCDVAAVDIVSVPHAGVTAGLDGPSWTICSTSFLRRGLSRSAVGSFSSSSFNQSCIIRRRLLVGFSGTFVVSELLGLFFDCSGAARCFSVLLLPVLVLVLGAPSLFSMLT
jgi:hypothetical protein